MTHELVVIPQEFEIPQAPRSIQMFCPECWKGEPPRQWHRQEAPVIPGTKAALLKALESALPDRVSEYKNLLKTELKAYFKEHVRGKRHPHDPIKGTSKLKKDELIERLVLHGVPFGENDKKGDLILKLREHWNAQCCLGPELYTAQESDDDSWELID